MTPQTLDAITKDPMRLKYMTEVQKEVLGLLPDLAAPVDEDGYVMDYPEEVMKDLRRRASKGEDITAELGELTRRKEQEKRKPDGIRDLLVRAKTGTGKTLAFLVPAIEHRIRHLAQIANAADLAASGQLSDGVVGRKAATQYARTKVGTLIVSPTRELATQIANDALRLSHHHKGFEVRLFIGQVSKSRQLRDFMVGRRDVMVCTPGRLRDMLMSSEEVREAVKGVRTVRTSLILLISYTFY
jgi:ATP-dependent RNA helicase MSS116, mitochondrial